MFTHAATVRRLLKFVWVASSKILLDNLWILYLMPLTIHTYMQCTHSWKIIRHSEVTSCSLVRTHTHTHSCKTKQSIKLSTTFSVSFDIVTMNMQHVHTYISHMDESTFDCECVCGCVLIHISSRPDGLTILSQFDFNIYVLSLYIQICIQLWVRVHTTMNHTIFYLLSIRAAAAILVIVFPI